MVNCDCEHSFEDHNHPEGGLQYCKKCDCKSAGITTVTEIQFVQARRGSP